jgi:Flp pilus assembly secretin CpaC
MSIRLGLAALLSAAILAGAGTPSLAADPVTVKVNMARILRISAPASTVIIGNPGVADVTIQDPQTLVLTGKSYGQTNLIVLDAEGNPVADTLVEVVQEQANLVTVYMGSKRTSVACAPVCQPVIMLGDDSEYATSSASASQAISSLANGN